MLRCRAKPSSVLDLDAGDGDNRRSRKHRKEKKEKKERDRVKNKKDKKDKKDRKERSGETGGAAERAPGEQGGPARLWRPWGSRPIGALPKPVLPLPPPTPPGGLKGISLDHFCALALIQSWPIGISHKA